MRYSIIVVNYNGKHLLDTCLSALVPQVDSASNIVLVDNGSVDGSLHFMNQNWADITTIPLETNTGFTGANNAGSSHSNSDFIVLLNNDTRVAPGWLDNLLEPFEDPSVGAVTSSMRKMGSIDTMDSAGGSLDYLGYTFDRGRGEPAGGWTTGDEVLFPCGGAMAVRRSALEDGHTVFWDTLFLYNEDTDLGMRLWKNGYRIVYQPRAVVEHILSATAGKTNPVRVRYCSRNRILVMRRHLGERFKKISSVLSLWEVMALGFMVSRGQISRFRASVSGCREGFAMKVAPYGSTRMAAELYSRFMLPVRGTAVRKKLGVSVYNRINASRR